MTIVAAPTAVDPDPDLGESAEPGEAPGDGDMDRDKEPVGAAAGGRPWMVRATAGGWALVGVIYAIEAATIVRANRLWLAHRMPDDALYYLETAQRMARGQGPTFDGLHRTNGFHPLWEAMSTGLALLFPHGGDPLIKAALLTNLALSLVAVILVYRLLRRVVGPLGAIVAVLVSVHATAALATWVNGMESAAVLAALALLLTALDWFDRRRDLRSAALAGAAAGLVVLARVDMATVIWLVPVWMVWRCRHERRVNQFTWLLAWGAAAGVPTAAWAGFNLATVGHVLPVSGLLKLHAMVERAQSQFGGRLTSGYFRFVFSFVGHYLATLAGSADAQGVRFFPLTVLALAALVLVAARRLLRPGVAIPGTGVAGARSVLLLGLAIVAAKAVTDLALLPFWAEEWYSAPARVAAGLLIGLGAYHCLGLALRHLRVVGVALAVMAVAAVLPFDGLRFLHSPSERAYPSYWQDADVEAITWITAHGPVGVYGSTDAGVLGYYLDPGRPVVNLDGLVNDYRYAAMLERGVPPLQRYQAEGVRYLVGRLGTPGSQNVPPCAVQLWRSSQGVIYGGSGDSPGITTIPLRLFDLGGCPLVVPAA